MFVSHSVRCAVVFLLGLLVAPAALHAQRGPVEVHACVQDQNNGMALEGVKVIARQGESAEATGATGADGCVRLSVGVMVGNEETTPVDFAVGPLYPNPTTHMARVSLSMAAAQPVAWRLYDVLGRLVRDEAMTLVPAGHHTVAINLNGLPDGRYLLHLRGGTTATTQTLIKTAFAPASTGATSIAPPAAHATASTLLTFTASHTGYDPLVIEQEVMEGETVLLPMQEWNVTPRPLMDMAPGERYFGFEGGLYPDGESGPPARHHDEGVARARAIQPLGQRGYPDPNGRIALLSIGFSNTTQEFCGQNGTAEECEWWSFVGQALADAEVNHETLVLADGANGGKPARDWVDPVFPEYDRIRDDVLASLGLTEAQVQVVWLKVNNPAPVLSLPDPEAEAFSLIEDYGNILRALKVRYPNLQQVFFSSRIYGGYASTDLHPEPYAYETAFGVKWTIAAQINQMESGQANARAGDLTYGTAAPWVGWGAYLWANGTTPRSDGLIWEESDFQHDGTHPAKPAETKVGGLLLDFFKASPYTRCWFLADGGSCGE